MRLDSPGSTIPWWLHDCQRVLITRKEQGWTNANRLGNMWALAYEETEEQLFICYVRMAPGGNSGLISSCTTAWLGHSHPCCKCLQGSHKPVCQRERGPWCPEPHPRWRGQPSPVPLLPSVGHRGTGARCGGFAAELRPGHGDTPMGSVRDSCRQAIPHLVSALQGAGRKMLLTRKCEEWNRHEEYRHRELGLMRTRGTQRTGTCEIVPSFSVGTGVQNLRRVSRWPHAEPHQRVHRNSTRSSTLNPSILPDLRGTGYYVLCVMQ